MYKKYFLKLATSLFSISTLSACQMGYYTQSAYNQMKILAQRTPIEKKLTEENLSEDFKHKLNLSLEAHRFAVESLKLKDSKSYTTYVDLQRPYVTYVVSAAPKWELKHHLWSFPFVGSVPYKGYFDEDDAKTEELSLQKQNLDTYLRGVSAYSTLGWFDDPLLSTMIKYSEHDLVNTVIHETVHTTLYIKNSADFNERLAVFIGNKGTELFYFNKEGINSPTLQKIKDENEDDQIFSKFISAEIVELENWYKENIPSKDSSQTADFEAKREDRLALIQEKFRKNILPLLKSNNYHSFSKNKLNNAKLLIYKTYTQDLIDFESLYKKANQDIPTFIELCKSLEKSKNPAEELKKMSQK